MTVTLMNPAGLPEIGVYRQVAIASGSKQIFVAGQVSWDADGVTVGEGDLAAQVEQCYLNVGIALAAAGASFDDVTRLSVYIADWTPDKMPLFLKGVAKASAKLGVTPLPPATLLGVTSLAIAGHLVEVEATAVLD
ncbi:RidA family protein [Amycolatopsis sp. NPDC059027]|uniref:RidA family protein n=1 Tax=Amycolatopsis sp. NPDC059027 TaxID=3346709 RepID=UPI003672F66A